MFPFKIASGSVLVSLISGNAIKSCTILSDNLKYLIVTNIFMFYLKYECIYLELQCDIGKKSNLKTFSCMLGDGAYEFCLLIDVQLTIKEEMEGFFNGSTPFKRES